MVAAKMSVVMVTIRRNADRCRLADVGRSSTISAAVKQTIISDPLQIPELLAVGQLAVLCMFNVHRSDPREKAT